MRDIVLAKRTEVPPREQRGLRETCWFSYCSRKWRTLPCDPIKTIADKPEDYSFKADLRTVYRNPGLHQVACKLFLDGIERYLSEKLAPEFWKMLNVKNVDVSFNLWHCVRVKQLIFNIRIRKLVKELADNDPGISLPMTTEVKKQSLS